MTKSKTPLAPITDLAQAAVDTIETVNDFAGLVQMAIPVLILFEGAGDGDPSTSNLEVYADSAGWATVGHGHLLLDPETKRPLAWHIASERNAALRMYPEGITRGEAETILIGDVAVRVASLRQHTFFRSLTARQQLAILSLSFNIGVSATLNSSLVRLIEGGTLKSKGQDFSDLHRQAVAKAPITTIDEGFTAWCRETLPNGTRRVNDGLFTRRYAELSMFEGVAPKEAIAIAWKQLAKFRGSCNVVS